ncbi:MAG: DNA repair protein RecN [Deltaproteobacteria bacterium]|nr:MAG: DNA repair protein RecN [Deltaproteobacteria bacterium]
MLTDLRIRNLAVVEDLEIAFEPGLNVITGETGAGKTILMRALGLLLGDRGGPDLLRAGASEGEVEALFNGAAVAAALAAHDGSDSDGPPADDDAASAAKASDEATIRRVVTTTRQRAYVNDRLVTAARLGEIGERLVHVYGQHEHHTLLRPETQRALLDDAGDLGALTAAMRAHYRALVEAEARLAAVRDGAAGVAVRRELLEHQVGELRRAVVRAGETEELEREREILRHAERLRAAAAEAEQAIYAGDAAVVATVARHAGRLTALASIDPELGEAARLLDDARPALEEAALRLGARLRAIAADPERLERVEERLALVQRLARKLGCAPAELGERQARLERELAGLEHDALDPGALEREVETATARAWEAADALTAGRRRAAAALGARITAGLRELALRGAELTIALEPLAPTADESAAGLSASGAERVVFLFAPNRGEPPRPLALIASGGELSRVMLALKAATAGASDVPTLIFDEVDAGIGGAVAEVVGRKLRQLARGRQVLCITHLPQIAACADHHYVVRKRPSRGRTRSSAARLSDSERVEELARMLGGVTITAQARRHAAELRRLGERVEE